MTKKTEIDPETIPEDVLRSWHNVVRSAQAACKDNNGLAIVTISVAVRYNQAILWSPPQLNKLMPAAHANVEVDPEIISVLAAFLQRTQVDTS